MYKLVWKTQSSNATQDEMHETLGSAIKAFRGKMEGLYAHGGGMVAILEEEFWETGAQALVKWEEHLEGGFGNGTAWYDVNPAENLDKECKNEGCCWHDEESEKVAEMIMCEECEAAGLEMTLAYLERRQR